MGLLQQLFAICQPSFFGDVDLLPSLKELDAFAAFPFGVQLPSADLFRRTIVVYGVNGANSCSPMCRCAPHGDKSANAQSQYVKNYRLFCGITNSLLYAEIFEPANRFIRTAE
jgi:hypothetical protein